MLEDECIQIVHSSEQLNELQKTAVNGKNYAAFLLFT